MTEWQPFSVRRGLREAREPQHGITEPMQRPLAEWFADCFRDLSQDRANNRARALCLAMDVAPDRYSYESALSSYITSDEDKFLEIIDTLLHAKFQ
jgi:uncharacterized membrane protein YccC